MVPWEVWVSTILVLFGAITGVSLSVNKVAKESAKDLKLFTEAMSVSTKTITREVGEIKQELRDHCKQATVPCPLHDSINKAIEATDKLVHDHQRFHLEHASSQRLIDGRADQDTYYGEQKQA